MTDSETLNLLELVETSHHSPGDPSICGDEAGLRGRLIDLSLCADEPSPPPPTPW
jgi:hypothetical protein